jgi:hypothetical protein
MSPDLAPSPMRAYIAANDESEGPGRTRVVGDSCQYSILRLE